FAILEAHIPQLFAGKRNEDQVRVWVPGCASGEEAYSIGMLLCEHAKRLQNPPAIQVFASDIDDQAVAEARDGLYPPTIEADVSPERLRHFFGKENGRYRIRKDLRQKILFASHNLLKDAPFSRLDLVCCRNLLIYLNAKAQEQVFDIFHFSLRSGGLLFIGGSETESSATTLFSPVDAKHRLYVRRSVPRPSWKVPLIPIRSADLKPPRRLQARPRALPPLITDGVQEIESETLNSFHSRQERREVLFGELHLRLLEQYGPPSIVVNEQHDIVHLSEHAGRYLQFAAGEPTANVTKVAHPALRVELRTALFRAAQEKASIKTAAQTIEIEGTPEVISLVVQPMHGGDAARGFYLVLFENQNDALRWPPPTALAETGARELADDTQFLKEQLDITVEQYEAANQELRASNEELQAVNVEMRSATEELETSKEELQSVNEELLTVNHELKSSIEESSRTNADLTNLMASTDIGTIFLDRQLRIQRFTPSAQEIFNLIPADLGRPLSDITHKLAYEGLIADAEEVLKNLATVEREVRVGDESWYLTRVAPYRTAKDRIAGVVATFIDITRRKRAELELHAISKRSENQLHKFETVMTAVPDFIYHFDLEGRFTYVNQSLLDLWQKTSEEAVGKNFHELDYPPELAVRLERQVQEVIETRRPLKDETPYTSALGARQYEYIFFPLLAEDGRVEAVAGVTRDISERREAERALRESEALFRAMFEQANVGIVQISEEGRIMAANPGACAIGGYTEKELLGRTAADLTHPDDLAREEKLTRKLLAGEIREFTIEKRYLRKDGSTVWAN
ncbi:MAG: PAS domain S-box protein, partial [Chthoniobacterales bacterium]|nr:PAS domain S-box protein [Chthoniobacterales bacterium]